MLPPASPSPSLVLRTAWDSLGRPGKAAFLLLPLYFAAQWLAAPTLIQAVLIGALLPLLTLSAYRLLRLALRHGIWRLRNRLLVTYLFIAVVPTCLLLLMGWLGGYALTSQMTSYLVMSELDRQTSILRDFSQALERLPVEQGGENVRRIAAFYEQRFPGLQLLVQEGPAQLHYPESATLTAPPAAWLRAAGVVFRSDHCYLWARSAQGSRRVTILTPLTNDYLSGLVPGLGEVTASTIVDEQHSIPVNDLRLRAFPATPGAPPHSRLYIPEPVNRMDLLVVWGSTVPMDVWNSPLLTGKYRLALSFRTRPSAVLGTLFGRRVDTIQEFWPFFLAAAAILFLIVELISLVIGLSLTRTITNAVHELYEGTQRVMQGDFRHRIEVQGQDQLATLGHSFNQMTAHLERLLAVAKEKERMQSELEIAREVQGQLFPKVVPQLPTLTLQAQCLPARMVSGDYYDYVKLEDGRLALAMGDVAGKGISAALLMATLQSCLRTHLRSRLELAAVAGQGADAAAGETRLVAHIVTQLNLQLHAQTSPEKYATLFFGLYDERNGMLTYTNAGHLQPLLVRGSQVSKLDVNGMVVGAFPFARYEASQVHLQPGDLLALYTDGITEPENEYGEMFGEDRLIDVLVKNLGRDEAQIIEAVTGCVREWTGSPELQDDMTMLVVRR